MDVLDKPDELGEVASRGAEAFLSEATPALLRMAGPLTASRPEAEDLVQETLLRVVRHWRRVAAAEDPIRYARRMLVNEAMRRNRRPHTSVGLQEHSLESVRRSGSSDAEAVLDSAEVRWLLGHLPTNQRAAVVLRYLEDASYDEIAAVMGCRAVTARSWVSRALKTLRVVHEGVRDSENKGSI